MSPGQPDATVVRRHLLALDEAVQQLRRHAGRPLSTLETDPDERWAVERGLHRLLNSGLDDFVHFGRFSDDHLRGVCARPDLLRDLRVMLRDRHSSWTSRTGL